MPYLQTTFISDKSHCKNYVEYLEIPCKTEGYSQVCRVTELGEVEIDPSSISTKLHSEFLILVKPGTPFHWDIPARAKSFTTLLANI